MIKTVENEIVMWLKEEKLNPQSVEDPNAFFNYQIKVGNLFLSVNQNTMFNDSITVSCNLLYTDDQLMLLEGKMDAGSKREYFNKLKTELTLHPYIWNFHISDKGVMLDSKRLYYCDLTKDSFMHMVYLMTKMFKLPIRLIDDYFQEFWPDWVAEDKGNIDLEKMK